MRYIFMVLLLACVSLAQAQLTVVSSTPANNATNVPLSTSISITFSSPLDTVYGLNSNYGLFWNIEGSPVRRYSADRRTVIFDVTLSSNTVYLVCVYHARAEGGATLQVPYAVVFTTSSAFQPYSVSGNVLAGSSGVSPANALVILSSTPVMGDEPHPVTGTIADGSGAFVLPHVANGTYYPVAAKDANGDGYINPSAGDVVAFCDPVTVNNANVTGLSLTFVAFRPLSLAAAITIADSISATLPPDKSLRYLGGWDVDTVGESSDWEFLYLRNSGAEGYRVQVGNMDHRVETMDSSSCAWLTNARPLWNPGSAASSSVFLTNVENNGGREFRQQPPVGNVQFSCQVNLGDLRWTNFGWLITDPNQDYWGARYSFGYDSTNQWVEVSSKNFIGNYSTGAIILVTDVDERSNNLPDRMTLSQNFPNPFNPSTEIQFSIPQEEWTTLKVYNLIGQEIATLVSGLVKPGSYTIRFDAGGLASGIYFYRLVSGMHVMTQKMTLMR